jgi:hypothetical protein
MQDKNADERKKRIKYIFDILEKNDCENLTIQYSGGGDDGQMELSDFSSKNDDKMRMSLDEPTIFESMYYANENLDLFHLLEEIAENLLNKLDVDWVNGNGSCGEVYFDVKKKTVTVGYQVVEEKEAVFTE